MHSYVDKPAASENDNSITLHSTSLVTAQATPIILAQTERVRVFFEPTIIDNPHDAQKCVKGKLIYEKKKEADERFPSERVSRKSVHVGECMEISLDSSETRILYDGLFQCYQLHDVIGRVQPGDITYTRINNEVGRILSMLQQNPTVANQLNSPSAIDLVSQLLRTLLSIGTTEEVQQLLSRMETEGVDRMWGAANIEKLRRLENLLRDNISNDDEEFWQTTFEENQWILAQVFGSPVTVFQSKAYVGGKRVDNQGAHLCDFLYRNPLTKNVALIEIKTPITSLMGSMYRADVYPFGKEISGAVSQVLTYKDSLLKSYRLICDEQTSVFNPMCIIIAGRLSSLSAQQIASFELCRSSLSGVQIVSYDEIIEKVHSLLLIVESKPEAVLNNDSDDIPF